MKWFGPVWRDADGVHIYEYFDRTKQEDQTTGESRKAFI